MKSLLLIMLILFLSNAFAQSTDTSSNEEVDRVNELKELISEVANSQKRLENELAKFENESSELHSSLHSLISTQQERLSQLLNALNKLERDNKVSLESNIENLNQEIQTLRQTYETFTAEVNQKLTETLDRSTETVTGNTNTLDDLSARFFALQNEFKNRANDLDKKLTTITDAQNANANRVDEISAGFKTELKNIDILSNADFANLQGAVNRNWWYWQLSIIVLLFLVVAQFLVTRGRDRKYEELLQRSASDTHSLKEGFVQFDGQIISLIDSQLKIVEAEKTDGSEDVNHTLALKVADEIVRIQKNLSRMDEGIKGLKQLSASVSRIQDNFISNGYEIVEMIGKPYNEGMKASANFIPDAELADGERVITRIIKPQVNYNGLMIQSAQIEVSQGE